MNGIKTCFIILSFSFIFSYSESFGNTPEELDYKPGELLVKFSLKPNYKQRTKKEKDAILSTINGGKIIRSYNLVPGLNLVKLPPNRTVKDSISDFNKLLNVIYVEPNYKIKLCATEPNDLSYNYLWGLHNTGQTGGTTDADIDAPEAWDITNDANNVVVAVIDTGVDYTHPDLINNMWINLSEDPNDANNDGYPGIQGVDDDGDSIIDINKSS